MKHLTFLAVVFALLFVACDARMSTREPAYKANECPQCKFDKGKCPSCLGTLKCEVCKGTGKIITYYTQDGEKTTRYETTCNFCKGTGKCSRCEGTGKCSFCKGTGISENWSSITK